MAAQTPKDQEYTLLYHPGIPGRGEFIRLAFEATGTKYSDPANESKDGSKQVYALLGDDASYDEAGNPPPFAPPMIKVSGAGKKGKDLLISQTSNILLYLGPHLNLAGSDEAEKYHINALTLTALDLNNETHDSHHPVAVGEYYEDQREEAKRRSKDFRDNRIPKFFGYFERVLKGNEHGDSGEFLVGGKLSYADLTLWQVLDGLKFAYPKELKYQESKYPLLFSTFYPAIKEQKDLKAYLESDRRLKYSMGVFRHYPELDRQD